LTPCFSGRPIRYIISGQTDFEKKMKCLYRKWPSAYELMPDDIYLNKRAMIYSDGHNEMILQRKVK
jgi:hypothetical protein